MPELPEVETVARDLRPLLIGQTLMRVRCGASRLRRPWQEPWSDVVRGSSILAVERRGKWLMLPLGAAQPSALLVHLGMTGQFTVAAADEAVPDHLHLTFDLDDGRELRFRDVRRFGSIEWFADADSLRSELNRKLGPEPGDLTREGFAAAVCSSQRTLKAILLDQSVVAGVGNIYADEALFRAKLHPEVRGSALSPQRCEVLRLAAMHVIAIAVEHRGSTIRDYVGGSGLRGEYQHELAAYGRTGEPCLRCGTAIEAIRVAGRSSHYCPKCQRKPG